MTVIIPSEKIAARWNGALQARLRQAPLENFLRSRGQKWVPRGESQVTDNLACATIYLVDGALNAYSMERRGPLAVSQHATVGQIACAVSHGLASLILQPNAWRIAALVAAARILAPYSGLDAAAHLGAAAARDYSTSLHGGAQHTDVLHIRNSAAAALEGNDEEQATQVMCLISQRLGSVTVGAVDAARTLALSYDLGGATVNSLTT